MAKSLDEKPLGFRRLTVLIIGTVLYSIGINLFVVPVNLYSAGILGLCQIIRTVFEQFLGVNFGSIDIAPILYYAINVPIMILAWIKLNRWFVIRTLICLSLSTVIMTFLPTTPLLEGDILANCLIGGVVAGLGLALVLRGGASLGGIDVVSLMLLKKHPGIRIGQMGLFINLAVYGICMFLFSIPTAIYSIVHSAVYSVATDNYYTQNIDVEATLITKAPIEDLQTAIFEELHRGVTRLEGTGGYTGEGTNVMLIALSQYEVDQLRSIVKRYDPHAFLVVKDHVKIFGNYTKKI